MGTAYISVLWHCLVQFFEDRKIKVTGSTILSVAWGGGKLAIKDLVEHLIHYDCFRPYKLTEDDFDELSDSYTATQLLELIMEAVRGKGWDVT